MNEQGLLHEIEEDLARKRMEAFWKSYGSLILGGALAIVLLTAAYTGWQTYQRGYKQKATTALIEIVDDLKMEASEKIAAYEKYAQDHKGDRQVILAKLKAASLALNNDQADKALSIYNEIAADKKQDIFFRQLGDLLAVQLQLDSGDPATLEARLNPLREKDGPWRFTAQEYAGYLALRAGDKEKAKKLFAELKAMPEVPSDIALRATDLVQWLNEGA